MPATLLEVEQGTCKLWITNYSQQPQLIPKGMNIGTLTNLEENTICSLNDVNPEKDIKNYQSRKRNTREKLRKLLDAELTSDEKEYLLHLLEDFGDIFDFKRASKNHGNTTVKYKINTGDSLPIKHRPYRVSAAERAVIETEVQKMLKEDVIKS
ncbi:hypothetical protein AVEN_272133-1 [Araneus ventricosus]|uniref:Peptidase A9 domain-containing protein n=1 Tax=Araneus ventricosus TaxID=182803 RepID=A0A4Y2P7A3_ARAVE|nr:hypothetical protein AVEN_272133-1 [Araneus ventricosus]